MHMNNGVTIEDMNTTYIYDDVEIGMDTIIHPNNTIKSGVTIGENCDIGPNAYIRAVSYTHLDVYKRQIMNKQPLLGQNNFKANYF